MAHPTWESFDPAWLVELADAQLPDQPDVALSLGRCRRCLKRSVAYWYFVPVANPNQPRSDWQFDLNITLECPMHGTLVLDVLKDGRIGGVEFLARVHADTTHPDDEPPGC